MLDNYPGDFRSHPFWSQITAISSSQPDRGGGGLSLLRGKSERRSQAAIPM